MPETYELAIVHLGDIQLLNNICCTRVVIYSGGGNPQHDVHPGIKPPVDTDSPIPVGAFHHIFVMAQSSRSDDAWRKGIEKRAGEEFDVIELTEDPGIYIVPVPVEVEDCKHSCTLEIDGRSYKIFKPGTMINRSIHREIEAAVRAKAGEEFEVLSLKEPYGIDVVPMPIDVARCFWSCKLKIDGRQYDVYIG